MKGTRSRRIIVIPAVILFLVGMVIFGYAGFPPIAEPPPGVKDPNTYHLTGPAFLAKIKMWKRSDTTVDLLLTGRCGDYKYNEDSIVVFVDLPINTTWEDLNREYFEGNGWDWSFSGLYFACGWVPNQYGTEWILASPVAVQSFSVGEDETGEFIEVSVIYLGRLLMSEPQQ